MFKQLKTGQSVYTVSGWIGSSTFGSGTEPKGRSVVHEQTFGYFHVLIFSKH